MDTSAFVDYKVNHSPHNLVTYKEPVRTAIDSLQFIMEDPGERALAENAIFFFLDNPQWCPRDKLNLERMWKRYGWNMFVWKYYRSARAFVGGYKALSAHLMLARIR